MQRITNYSLNKNALYTSVVKSLAAGSVIGGSFSPMLFASALLQWSYCTVYKYRNDSRHVTP